MLPHGAAPSHAGRPRPRRRRVGRPPGRPRARHRRTCRRPREEGEKESHFAGNVGPIRARVADFDTIYGHFQVTEPSLRVPKALLDLLPIVAAAGRSVVRIGRASERMSEHQGKIFRRRSEERDGGRREMGKGGLKSEKRTMRRRRRRRRERGLESDRQTDRYGLKAAAVASQIREAGKHNIFLTRRGQEHV